MTDAAVRYASARDLFEAARDAALEVERTRRTISRMEQAEGVRAQGYQPPVRRSREDVNGTARTDARIDVEERMRRRIDEDYRLIDLAAEVCYGAWPASGGVAALLGSAYADVLYFRYCQADPWGAVADKVGLSEKWCREAARPALDQVDAYGVDAVRQGLGLACA